MGQREKGGEEESERDRERESVCVGEKERRIETKEDNEGDKDQRTSRFSHTWIRAFRRSVVIK